MELELEGGDAHYSSQLADKEAPGGGAEQQVVISQSQFGGETDHSSHTAASHLEFWDLFVRRHT